MTGLEGLGEFLKSFAWIALVITILFVVVTLIISFVGSFGIMKLAKKNNMPYAWLAFVPAARSYLLGKLGFEIYAAEDKKNTAMPWVLLGLDLVMIIGSGVSALESTVSLISIALNALTVTAYYHIYKYLTPQYKKYTTLSFFFDGIPLLMNNDLIRAKDDNNVNIGSFIVNETNNLNQTNTNNVETPLGALYCSNCGNQLEANARFCGKCGKKIG